MSDPQNILSKFRTYSYHHILIACDNEAAARHIRSSNSLNTFRQLGAAQTVNIQDLTQREQDAFVIENATNKKAQTKVGSYVVILNGMIDTTYVVRDVNWFTTTAASTVQNDKFTSLAVEGSMTIEEPRGVNFLNDLNHACDILRSDPSGVIWLLKTIFIGYPDDGSTDPDYIVNLLPLEFMMYDVTGTFDVTGGVYEISFAGVSNGASRFPQFSQIAQGISVSVKDTLKETLSALEQKMDGNSRNNRICVIKKLKEAYTEFTDVDLEEFREVQYRIIAEPPYDDPAYIIDGLTDDQKELALEGYRQGVLKSGPKATVEGSIRQIMDRCGQVQRDATAGEGVQTGRTTYGWKIHSEITMVGKDTLNPIDKTISDKDIVVVSYRIKRFAEMTNTIIQDILDGSDDEAEGTDAVTKQRLKDNLITFDYFFTGKNIDILKFDLKMEMGLAFLQTLSSTNTMGTGTSQISGSVTEDVNTTHVNPDENVKSSGDVDAKGEKKKKVLIRSRTPIFPATNVNNVFQKNIKGPLSSTLYQSRLARHAAFESVEATLTIAGNPYLMSQTNTKSSDVQRKENSTDPGDESRIMQNAEFIPGIAKVNIRMPITSATPSSTSSFQTTKFWYDGYYYMYGIDHKFAGGEFTQDLHLLSLPDISELEKKGKTDITECGVEKEKKKEDDSTAGGADEGKTEPNANNADKNRPNRDYTGVIID